MSISCWSSRPLCFFAPRRFLHRTLARPLQDGPRLPVSTSVDDYYSLLLSDPTPDPASRTSDLPTVPKSPTISTSSSISPSATPPSHFVTPPDNHILFSPALVGPSARMRGIARGEKGLDRPPEPDNCCMSGCVNCVWDAYREEVEEWAAGRRRREAELSGIQRETTRKSGKVITGDAAHEGAVGVTDGTGDLERHEGMDLDDEGGLFEGVSVGIKEFMKQEKRIKEKKINKGG